MHTHMIIDGVVSIEVKDEVSNEAKGRKKKMIRVEQDQVLMEGRY